MSSRFFKGDDIDNVQLQLQQNENFKRVMKLSNADIANMDNSECVKAIEMYIRLRGR